MGIVSKLPFDLQVIKQYPSRQALQVAQFTTTSLDAWKNNVVAIDVEENEDINILFNTEDNNARLYLEALDVVPTNDCKIDEKGEIFRTPSPNEFVLTKQAAGYDSLKVDCFEIKILCDNKWFYGIFRVLPKQMSISEWQMMRNDLEKEIRGLAQDIIRHSIGIGNVSPGIIPPKLLYDFLVIKKYSRKILSAIVDIADNPRHEICTDYKIVPVINNSIIIDAETVKRYVTHSGSEAILKIPQKTINYNIQDNRILKKMITTYEKKLNAFVIALDNYSNTNFDNSIQGNNALRAELYKFKEIAIKLRKMTSVLHSKEWFKEISDVSQAHIPHSFVLDARYNMFYQLHEELKRENIKVEFDPAFSYTWKQSSKLYEMWCFIKICHILGKHFSMIGSNDMFSDTILFPMLKDGSKLSFENEDIKLEVIYNSILPPSGQDTDISNPLALLRFNGGVPTHNKPDIVINVFRKKENLYEGSAILECKYRKLQSFWSNNLRSSREQLETYFNNARSSCLLGEIGEKYNMRPVDCVFVLTPDIYGDGIIDPDFKMLIKSFKPSQDGNVELSVETEIMKQIEKLNKKSKDLVEREL